MCDIARAIAVLLVYAIPISGMGQDVITRGREEYRISDATALNALFGESTLADNALQLCRDAQALPAEDRFQFLTSWVLPDVNHQTFRIVGDFSSTDPSPLSFAPSAAESSSSKQTMIHEDLQQKTTLVSPVLELFEAARLTDRLEVLRTQIRSIEVGDREQRCTQAALELLVDMARNDFPAATRSYERLIRLSQETDRSKLETRWRELLVTWTAFSDPQMHKLVGNYFLSFYSESEQPDATREMDVVTDYLKVLQGLHDSLLAEETRILTGSGGQKSSQWIPYSHTTASSRGRGFPPAMWELRDGLAVKVAGHDADYLSFRSPLQGNFDVEFDASHSPERNGSCLASGIFAEWIERDKAVRVGNFRNEFRDTRLDPALALPLGSLHYRILVRKASVKLFLNGREALDEAVSPAADPWIAIRMSRRDYGEIRDFRITGRPIIPDEIELSSNPALPGWAPYFEESFAQHNSDWRTGVDEEGSTIIHSSLRSEAAGCKLEKLLRYHRPLIEDGKLEYQFFYQPGRSCVHPALDRLVLLLGPEGVRMHWLTDGKYDRSGLDPGNETLDSEGQRGPRPLKLMENDWNHLRLNLTGNTVQLVLNEQLVYERALEPQNRRTFGLFHYSGETEARAKNVVWRGNWPKSLPAVEQQQLADHSLEFLKDTLPELTEVFDHDFSRDGFDSTRFGIPVGDTAHLTSTKDGLRMTRPGGKGYYDTRLSPLLTLEGDFDVSARFTQFAPEIPAGGSGSISLSIQLDNAGAHNFQLSRRLLRHRATPQPILQPLFSAREVEGVARSRLTAELEEAVDGTLRLARRGEKIYFLFAEGNSENFQLIGEHPAVKDKVRRLQLGVQSQGDGQTSVLWKRLTVHAEHLSGLALSDARELLAELDRTQETLRDRSEHTFGVKDFTSEKFDIWGTAAQNDHTLRLMADGSDEWTSSGFAPRIEVAGDFDASFTLKDLKLGEPKAGLNSSLYFQIDFSDESKTQANILFAQFPGQQRKIIVENRTTDSNGNNTYDRIVSVPIEQIEGLRIARRGKLVNFLYRGNGKDHLLTQTEISDRPIKPIAIRTLLHTGGEGRSSEALLKKFLVYAEKISPPPDDSDAKSE